MPRDRSLWPWPVLVFLVEPRLAAFEADCLAYNPHLLHMGADVEDVAIGGEEGCVLAGLDGTEAISHTSNRTINPRAEAKVP